MATYTLLELVQSILSSMDGDEVSSYNDSQESTQVARLIRDTYYSLAELLELPVKHTLLELEASGDNNKPTIMYLPSNARTIEWIKYDKALSTESNPNFDDLSRQPLKDFLDQMYQLNTDDTNVSYYEHLINNDADTIDIFYKDDAAPTKWTTWDDYTILFDSYNADEDTTLQKSKTLVSATTVPEFTLSDSFVPDLADQQFPLLLNEAKAVCFAELRQTTNASAEKTARQHKIKSQKNKTRASTHTWRELHTPNYGRRRP